MSEHWKSTPKYWCKHCSTYVRDTKLERANHESTAKHQGAIKRSLRDLHRGHEREERDKDRARREIERLNGVVAGTPSTTNYGRPPTSQQGSSSGSQPSQATDAQLKKQREQLAELGVAVPSTFRPDMAMAGEWTVTTTRIVDPDERPEEKTEAKATGVRKREMAEEAKEEEDAIGGLFKKQKKWGRDSRTMPQGEDEELDALLSGSVIPKKQTSVDDDQVKEEEDSEPAPAQSIKQEQDDAPDSEQLALVKDEAAPPHVKSEEGGGEATPAAPVVFKKRKPKGLRQK